MLVTSNNEIVSIPIERLKIHPIVFEIYEDNEARMNELKESIKVNGIIEPLVVTPSRDSPGEYIVLSGSRRLRCAKELGFNEVPCIVIEPKDEVIAVIEYNRYRQKTPVELYNEAQILKKRLSEKARERQLNALRTGQKQDGEPIHTDKIVSRIMNVSEGYLNMLERVIENKDKIPLVYDRLRKGEATVYEAYKALRNLETKEVNIPDISLGRYFGGKYYLVKDIIARIPEHKVYVEPFGGFANVLLNKPKSWMEVYNDINMDVVNFMLCLREDPIALISELNVMPFSRWLFNQFKEEILLTKAENIPDCMRAAKWYYVLQLSFNGRITSGFKVSVKNNVLQEFRHKFSTLLYASIRFSDVTIENKDYTEIMELYDSEETFFYIDPPYYETDNIGDLHFTIEDYKKLRDILTNIKGKFLMTLNDHPDLRELFNGFKMDTVTQKKSAKKVENEARDFLSHLLIYNY